MASFSPGWSPSWPLPDGASRDLDLVVPAKILVESALSCPTHLFSTTGVAGQPAHGIRESADVAALHQQAIHFVSDHVGDTAGAVADHREPVGPGFQENQPKRVGSRR